MAHKSTFLAIALSGSIMLLPFMAFSDDSDFDISRQIGPDPVLPDPDPPLVANMKVAEVIGWSEGEMPEVPDGLTISAYAQDLSNPRSLHTLPNGDVLVVQARGPGGEPVTRPKDVIRGWIMSIAHGGGGQQKESNLITLLKDTDRDGKPDERHDLLTELNSPFGVAWIDDKLYVAATDAILVYPYHLGDTSITAKPQILTPLPGGPIDHHWTKDLALAPDGKFLYVSVGSNSNIAENGMEAEKGRAAIWQVDRQTGASRVYASGMRNPNGLIFNPTTRDLWAVVNERDELGPNLVPDYMTSVKEGAFYGWPWSYYGDHVDERVRPRRPDMVKAAVAPDYALSSHVAPLGMTFTMASALPEDFRNGAFVGEHGSWNRERFNGYKVVYVPFKDGVPSGKARSVITGFVDGDKAHGRPVGLAIDGTGALLVADDAGNTVWRIAAADGTTLSEPVGTDEILAGTGNGMTPTNADSSEETGQQPSRMTTDGQSSGTAAGQTPRPSADEQLTGQQPGSGAAESPAPSQTQIAPAVNN